MPSSRGRGRPAAGRIVSATISGTVRRLLAARSGFVACFWTGPGGVFVRHEIKELRLRVLNAWVEPAEAFACVQDPERRSGRLFCDGFHGRKLRKKDGGLLHGFAKGRDVFRGLHGEQRRQSAKPSVRRAAESNGTCTSRGKS